VTSDQSGTSGPNNPCTDSNNRSPPFDKQGHRASPIARRSTSEYTRQGAEQGGRPSAELLPGSPSDKRPKFGYRPSARHDARPALMSHATRRDVPSIRFPMLGWAAKLLMVPEHEPSSQSPPRWNIEKAGPKIVHLFQPPQRANPHRPRPAPASTSPSWRIATANAKS